MSILTDALDSLSETVRDDLGEPVVYESGTSRVKLLAIPSKSEQVVESNSGMLVEEDCLDWIFPAEDLALGGTIATPTRGDRIQRLRTPPGVQQVYEVLPFPTGQKCWVENDAFGRIITVHTKKLT